MTDNSLGEALSAALDGEASEFELRRVLRDLDSDQLRAQAFRYQLQGQLMREERSAFSGIDLSGAIRTAIDEEAVDENLAAPVAAGSDIRFWHRPWARAAVAASVTLAVIFGVNTYNRADLNQTQVLAAADQSAPLVRTPALTPTNPVGAQSLLAGLELNAAPTAGAPGADQDRMAQAHQRQALRLESYMRQHTAQTVLTSAQGALPFARVASFDAPK